MFIIKGINQEINTLKKQFIMNCLGFNLKVVSGPVVIFYRYFF